MDNALLRRQYLREAAQARSSALDELLKIPVNNLNLDAKSISEHVSASKIAEYALLAAEAWTKMAEDYESEF